MHPLIKHWSSQALSIAVNLDYGLGIWGKKQNCLRHSLLVHSDLISSGSSQIRINVCWSLFSPFAGLVFIGILPRVYFLFLKIRYHFSLRPYARFSSSRIVSLLGCWLRVPGVSFPVCLFLAIFARLWWKHSILLLIAEHIIGIPRFFLLLKLFLS